MRMKHLIFSVLIFICVSVFSTTALFCYWNTGCPYKYFGSKTPYNAVRGDIRDSIVKVKGCEPISIWGLYRHGKRYPGSISGNHMKSAVVIRDSVLSSYLKGDSSLCAQDVENLRDSTVDVKMFNKPHELTDEGYQEMVGLAKRLKQVFPNLLNKLDDGHYTFRSAFGQNIVDSVKAFVKGLDHRNLKIEDTNSKYDFIAPYLTCEKYKVGVMQNPNLYGEVNKYLGTSQYLAIKDRIHRRAGIMFNLTDDNITALYDLCRYTWSAIDNRLSPWCALFTTEDLQVLEYMDDLKHYYKSGYGSPLSEKLGHIPMSELLKAFQLAKNGSGKKITSYFTHDVMLNMVYTSLGIFKDDDLLTGSQRNSKRKWRTSKLSTFSGNFVAVLNRCLEKSNEDYTVVFYLNEEPLRSLCKEGICTFKEFEEKLMPFVNVTLDFCDK